MAVRAELQALSWFFQSRSRLPPRHAHPVARLYPPRARHGPLLRLYRCPPTDSGFAGPAPRLLVRKRARAPSLDYSCNAARRTRFPRLVSAKAVANTAIPGKTDG